MEEDINAIYERCKCSLIDGICTCIGLGVIPGGYKCHGGGYKCNV